MIKQSKPNSMLPQFEEPLNELKDFFVINNIINKEKRLILLHETEFWESNINFSFLTHKFTSSNTSKILIQREEFDNEFEKYFYKIKSVNDLKNYFSINISNYVSQFPELFFTRIKDSFGQVFTLMINDNEEIKGPYQLMVPFPTSISKHELSFLDGIPEREAFNVSNLKLYNTLNEDSFFKKDVNVPQAEEVLFSNFNQSNIGSINGQCPYFVNEKQYEAIIRRRKKKQRKMMMYGKQIIL
jgi:hypothetical protein